MNKPYASTTGGSSKARGDLGPPESVPRVHAATPDRLRLLRQAVQARLPRVPIHMVGEVAPVVGAHAGPGAVGLVSTRTPEPQARRS